MPPYLRNLAKNCCLSVGFFLLAGCAMSKQITGPNGEILHSINCSGTMLNMGMCLEKAGKICGSHGYEIVMGGTNNQGAMVTAGQYGYFSSPYIERELVIRCKGGPGSRPAVRPPDYEQSF